MIYTANDLLKLILDTHAVSIWNRDKGPVFWYTANVPGPFYVNTEMVIGKELSERMLAGITAIVEKESGPEGRATALTKLILDAYGQSEAWQSLIATMIDCARKEFAPGSYAMISGGERRDWLFSIPFAHEAGLPHLFLFKNGSTYCAQPFAAGQSVLHVSDLINNAVSFFDLWEPALRKEKLSCAGNACVTVRGEAGIGRLREAGQKVANLITIDTGFFRSLEAAGLVSHGTVEEMEIFFKSSQDWASAYLIDKPELFDVEHCDEKKSFARLRAFIAQDPWGMRPRHEAFFAEMQKAIDARSARKA
ncbi:MAG: hypothetical protein PHE27_01910 [Alphaproteobacteria bacterium]|nr:hypothetical protein [Alphaproteobacteria bacterium]